MVTTPTPSGNAAGAIVTTPAPSGNAAPSKIAMRTFTATCLDPPSPRVVYSEDRDELVTAHHVLSRSEPEVTGSYWIAPTNIAHFVLDLGCVATVTAVELVNIHLAEGGCCSTKDFSVWTALSYDKPEASLAAGEWKRVVYATDLEDSRNQIKPPLQRFEFKAPSRTRFIMFKIWGKHGQWGGLQYFNPISREYSS